MRLLAPRTRSAGQYDVDLLAGDETFLDIVKGWVSDADAYLFGHRTYEAFARDWPNMPDPEDPVAQSLNGLARVVHEFVDALADQLMPLVAEQPFQGRIAIDDE